MLPDRRRDKWLDTAVSGIRFYVDRVKVREELAGHMEDKMADLQRVFPDIPEEEARTRVLAGMGDAEEVKKELAKVHKPWLGWLWQVSRVALVAAMVAALFCNVMEDTGPDTSIFSRSSHSVYHQVRGGKKARLGQYTFQITGAAYLERPEVDGAHDEFQIVLRVSSPVFWERIDVEALRSCLSAVGPDGVERPMDQPTVMRYTVEDGLGGTATWQQTWTGLHLASQGPWYREFAIYIPAEDWEPGDSVTLEVDSGVGSISLSVPVTEEVRVQ